MSLELGNGNGRKLDLGLGPFLIRGVPLLPCPQLLPWPPIASMATHCFRGHPLLPWPPVASVATCCFHYHPFLPCYQLFEWPLALLHLGDSTTTTHKVVLTSPLYSTLHGTPREGKFIEQFGFIFVVSVFGAHFSYFVYRMFVVIVFLFCMFS